MTTTTTGSLASFDHVARGDDAPAWVHDGVCRAWGLDAGATAVTLIAVSENVTFKVTVAGHPTLVVRLGRPGYAESVEHVRSELVWVDALQKDVGVPTPSPRTGVDGDFVQFLTDETGAAWTAVAFDFVPGTILEESLDFDGDGFAAHFVEIGRVTAQLHEHARGWQVPASFRRFAWNYSDMVGPTARWGTWGDAPLGDSDRAIVQAAETRALELLAAVDPSPEHWGLIHGDLRPSNVMTAPSGGGGSSSGGSSSGGSSGLSAAGGSSSGGSGELTIIDFDDCGYGWFLYDFGAALTFYEHRPAALEMGARWLDGYRSVAPLSAADLATAGALSMMRRLTMLGWATTHRPDALPADLWDENLPGTVECAARFVADPLWFVRG